jgi:hypothetical protein
MSFNDIHSNGSVIHSNDSFHYSDDEVIVMRGRAGTQSKEATGGVGLAIDHGERVLKGQSMPQSSLGQPLVLHRFCTL